MLNSINMDSEWLMDGRTRVDYAKILMLAKQGGKISSTVITDVRKQLRSAEFKTDPYTLIHILGKAGDFESHATIAKYLMWGLKCQTVRSLVIQDLDEKFDDDDENYTKSMVRRIAVIVLGRFWKMKEHFDELCDSASSDPSGYVRMVAAGVIGELGAKYPELRAASCSLLLQGVRHQFSDPYASRWYYDGILDYFAVPIVERPGNDLRLDEIEIRQDLILRAEKVASGQGS